MCSKEIEFAKDSVYAVTFAKMHYESRQLIALLDPNTALSIAQKDVWGKYCRYLSTGNTGRPENPWTFMIAVEEILEQVVNKKKVAAIADYMKLLKEAESDFAEDQEKTTAAIIAYLDERVHTISEEWISKL